MLVLNRKCLLKTIIIREGLDPWEVPSSKYSRFVSRRFTPSHCSRREMCFWGGACRLRVALSASHTPADIAALVAALPLNVKAKALQHAPCRSLSHPSIDRSAPRNTSHTQQCQFDGKSSEEVEDGDASFHTFVFNHAGVIHISRL